MASPFVRAALAAASRHRASTLALALAAPRGAAPSPPRYPLLPLATAERVGGLLPRRAGASTSSAAPAQVRAAAFSTDARAAREEVQGLGKNGGKAVAGEGQEGAAAAAAAASPCKFDENLAAHLKIYIRGELTKETEHQSLILLNLFEGDRNYRDAKNRSESYRQLVFSALIAVFVVGGLMGRKEDRAKGGGTGGDKVVEEVGEETGGDKVAEDDSKAGGKAGTGAEDTKDGGKAGDAEDSKAGGAEDSTGGGKAGGSEDSKQGGSAEDSKAGSCSGAEDSKAGGEAAAKESSATAVESKGAAATP